MRGPVRVLAAGVAVILLGGAAACSEEPIMPLPQSSYAQPSASTDGEATPEESEVESPVRNDLAKLPHKRTINAGSVRINVEYNSQLAADMWRADATKPLRISLTAVNRRKQGQKIYLSKATATMTAYDDRGQVDSRAVNDTANISPGYIVTFPNTYNQNLQLPAVDSTTTWVTIDLTYELVLEVDKTKQGNRDFAKQVASDTITVPLAG